MKINVKKLNPDAIMPTYGSEFAAGADLYACLKEPVTVAPHTTAMIPTGLAIELPVGYAGLIYARSGLASKRNLAPANKVGVVDCDYRGEVKVALHNHGEEPQTVASEERIAQLVIAPYLTAEFAEAAELSSTVRGEGGFGSTGYVGAVGSDEYYLGIDIGGTTVKCVVADGNGKVLADGSVPTESVISGDKMCSNIAGLCEKLQKKAKVTARAAGVGCPGMIASDGTVIFAGNLKLKNFPLTKKLSALLKMPVTATNDANAAALGEAAYGAGSEYRDSIFITLGTGVGGGIVLDGKLFEGGGAVGTEIGHMVTVHGGNKCTCGRHGCYETYASATALIRETKKAMEENRDSKMWGKYSLDTVCGKTAFDYADTDKAAKAVVDEYVYQLACGIINLANIFRPQVIILGGGVAEQGEKLIKPLQKKLDEKIFGGQDYAPVKIVKASLGNLAGALGTVKLASGH